MKFNIIPYCINCNNLLNNIFKWLNKNPNFLLGLTKLPQTYNSTKPNLIPTS